MRTRLDIDDDVLRAAREIARRDRISTGAAISALARKALAAGTKPSSPWRLRSFYGFGPFPRRGPVVTNDLVDRLREGDVY